MSIRILALSLLISGLADAQLTDIPPRPEFEVASVKLSTPGKPPRSNIPIGPGDVYVPNGGFFSATSQPLINYLSFAYKISSNQAWALNQRLPDWVKTEQYDIEARASGDPGKEQMRMMMRTLLLDRFKLTLHQETREVPALAFVLSKPAKTGPQLRPHPNDASCSIASPSFSDPGAAAVWAQASGPGFPELCNGVVGAEPAVPGRIRRGGRNLTMGFIAEGLSGPAELDMPVVDHTGMNGTFDFVIEWQPEILNSGPPGVDSRPDSSGPTFRQALQEQLGLKLETTRAAIEVWIVDHIERATAN